jgi:hypothetical protein
MNTLDHYVIDVNTSLRRREHAMSKIADKIAPKIKLYEYLDDEIEELKRVFDRNWKTEKDDWRYQPINYLLIRLKAELKELEDSIDIVWTVADERSSLAPRMMQVRLEFLEIALRALKGADKANREAIALKERDKETKKRQREVAKGEID